MRSSDAHQEPQKVNFKHRMLSGARTPRTRWVITIVAASIALLIAAIAGTNATSAATSATAMSKADGVATFALDAGRPPQYIFPFLSPQYASESTIWRFQYQMYRPLYFWNGNPYKLDRSKSIALPPIYSNKFKTVTIPLKKNWYFSNGERITPKNVAFFLGLLVAERANFWGYLPSAFPDSLKSVSYNTAKGTVSLHMKTSVNPNWFIQNQLTMLTPFPTAWDLVGPR